MTRINKKGTPLPCGSDCHVQIKNAYFLFNLIFNKVLNHSGTTVKYSDFKINDLVSILDYYLPIM